jgi:hypothetical protein
MSKALKEWEQSWRRHWSTVNYELPPTTRDREFLTTGRTRAGEIARLEKTKL